MYSIGNMQSVYFVMGVHLRLFTAAAIAGIFVGASAFGQVATTATTEDGRKVQLNEDGTWKLLKGAVAGVAGSLKKPANAKKFVKAPKGPFGVWIDEAKWTQKESKEESANKLTFTHKSDDAYAMIIGERIMVATDALKKVALENAKGVAPDIKMVSEEKRTLNGKQVMCLKMSGTIQTIPFIYYGYYYGGNEGTLQVICYTSANLFDEFKADFDDFLNGTQIGQKAAAE
jgi:hypothetical protein